MPINRSTRHDPPPCRVTRLHDKASLPHGTGSCGKRVRDFPGSKFRSQGAGKRRREVAVLRISDQAMSWTDRVGCVAGLSGSGRTIAQDVVSAEPAQV